MSSMSAFHSPQSLRFIKATTSCTLSAAPGGAVLERPKVDLKPKHSTAGQNVKAKGWELRILNDSLNTREHVARCLVQVVGEYEDSFAKPSRFRDHSTFLIGLTHPLLKIFSAFSNSTPPNSRCFLPGKSESEAYNIMMHAHKMGAAVCGVFMQEQAEMYREQLIQTGLLAEITPVD